MEIIVSTLAIIISLAALIVTFKYNQEALSLTRQQVNQSTKQLEQNTRQLESSYEVQKATFFKELYLMMYADPGIKDAFYLLDFDEFTFSRSDFQSLTTIDKAKFNQIKLIDNFLNYCNLLCVLYFRRMLTEQEMRSFEYMFTVTYTNSSLQEYVTYVKEIFEQEIGKMPWPNFILYCQKMWPGKAFLSFDQKALLTDLHIMPDVM